MILSLRLGFLLPGVVIGFIFFLSSRDPSQVGANSDLPNFDKWIHALMYAALLCSFCRWRGQKDDPIDWIPGAAAGSLFVGICDELHQMWIPGRSSDGWDVAADAAGIGVCAVLWIVSARFRSSCTESCGETLLEGRHLSNRR